MRRAMLLFSGLLFGCDPTRIPILQGPNPDCASAARAVPTWVQGSCGFSPSPAQSTALQLEPIHLGNLIIVAVNYASAGQQQVTSVTDSLGTHYLPLHPLTTFNGQADSMRAYYAFAASGGADTVTATLDQPLTTGNVVIFVHEYSGLSQLDHAQAQPGNTVDPQTAVLNTAMAGELLFAHAGNIQSLLPGTGFVARGSCRGDLSEDRVSGEPGAYSASFKTAGGGGNSWAALIAAFLPRTCLDADP
jgi:hypothetical protein